MVRSPFSRTPSPAPSDASSAHSLSQSPPRRPRLHHPPPPHFSGWAHIRFPPHKSKHLRFVSLSGVTLHFSASPTHSLLSASILVHGALIERDDFPTARISVRATDGARVLVFPESRKDLMLWSRLLDSAAARCIRDSYQLVAVEHLSTLGSGCVSVARRLDVPNQLDQFVLVKTSCKDRMSQEQIRRVRNEPVVVLGMKRCKYIMDVVDVYESRRSVYVVIRKVGLPLMQLVEERGLLSEAQVAGVIKGVLKGLLFIHQYRVSHRAIMPTSVRVSLNERDEVERVVIANFEHALTMDKQIDTVTTCQQEHTLDQIRYVAPEIVRMESTDYISADVWMCGILMHFLLVGCTPFQGGDINSVINRIKQARGVPVFGGGLWRGVSSGARDLCRSMLRAEAAGRIQVDQALKHKWLNVEQQHK